MKKKHKIYQFDFGKVEEQDDQVRISISKEQFSNEAMAEIKTVETDNDDFFLNKEKIIENEHDYVVIYKKDKDRLKNMVELKKEEYPVRVAIAERLLEQDILKKYQRYNLFISLDPSTLYYYPMNEVKYTYSGNQFMPRAELTALERYKAVVVSILTTIPYGKCIKQPDDVKEQGNDLVKEIYDTNSREELLKLIRDSRNVIDYNYIKGRENEKSKWKTWLIASVLGLGIFAFAGIVLTQVVNTNRQHEIVELYEQDIESYQLKDEADEAMANGNYEEAVNLYEQANTEPIDVAEELINHDEYQLALNVHDESLENIIQKAYAEDNKQQLVDLEADDLSDEASRKLSNEQAIVRGDSNELANVFNFLSDEKTAERLAEKYIELNDLNRARDILEKYPENETIMSIVQRAEIQEQIAELENQLEETDDEDTQEEIQEQIEESEKELENLD